MIIRLLDTKINLEKLLKVRFYQGYYEIINFMQTYKSIEKDLKLSVVFGTSFKID